MNSYIYIQSDKGPLAIWTVGYEDHGGRWHPESDHRSEENAAARVHYLNGGQGSAEAELRCIQSFFGVYEIAFDPKQTVMHNVCRLMRLYREVVPKFERQRTLETQSATLPHNQKPQP